MTINNTSDIFYKKIKSSFNNSASSYDKNAVLQHEIGARLISRLDFFKLNLNNNSTILDLGLGTGYVTKNLISYFNNITHNFPNFIALDLAENMLQVAKTKNLKSYNNYNLLCCDINKLAIADNSIDVIFSNFAMQWSENINNLFKECYRILKKEGLLIFTIPGPDTLYELKESFNNIDPDYDHINNQIDMHNIGDMLIKNKFADTVVDNDYFTLTYSNSIDILKDLKYTGTNINLSNNNRKSLITKNKLNKLNNYYNKFKLSNNKLPVTYEVIFGHAFKPAKNIKAKYPDISGVGLNNIDDNIQTIINLNQTNIPVIDSSK